MIVNYSCRGTERRTSSHRRDRNFGEALIRELIRGVYKAGGISLSGAERRLAEPGNHHELQRRMAEVPAGSTEMYQMKGMDTYIAVESLRTIRRALRRAVPDKLDLYSRCCARLSTNRSIIRSG